MLSDLGLTHPHAAKMLHISLRTLQNWMTGVNPPPYMAIKLLRMLRYMELPGLSWQGWSFSRGMLVTPEGRTISGHDSAWWSQLVRRAHSFSELYQRQKFEKLAELHTVHAPGLGAVGTLPDAGLVSVSTSHTDPQSTWGQDGAIIGSWPTISDFPPLLMPMPEPDANASVSASTPSCASPWMPISDSQSQTVQNPEHPHISGKPLTVEQPQAQRSTPDIPGLRLTPLSGRPQLVNPANCLSSVKPNAGNSPSSSAKHAKTFGAGRASNKAFRASQVVA